MSSKFKKFSLPTINIRKKFAKTLSLTTFTIVSLTTATTAWSGAWVPDIGSGYSKFAFSDYSADDFFGDNSEFGSFSGQNLSFYGEYGFTKNGAIYGTVLYQDLEQVDSAGVATSSSGFGDVELGYRYQWQAAPFVLSTAIVAKLPYLYDDSDALPRGNGQEDLEFRVLIGKSLDEYGYFGAEFGYRLRFEAPSDEYRYLLEYGYSVTDNFYLRTKLDGTLSANNADGTGTGSNLSITPEFDLGKLELTAGWTFGTGNQKEKWGLEFTYREDLYGDNTLQGDGIEVGIFKIF